MRRYVLTEDDGITVGYKAGQVRTTEFALQPSNGNAAGVSLSIAVSGYYAGSMELFWCVPSPSCRVITLADL